MLKTKIESRQSGILLYGITPPKLGHSPEKLSEIAARQLERISGLGVDGLVLYDIQDESARNANPRPFPFIQTEDPLSYSLEYLSELQIPKIIYRGVGRYSPDTFRQWLNEKCAKLEYLVLVGSPSKEAVAGLSLADAYQLKSELNNPVLLGGVTIPERHSKRADEHLRVISKTMAGCRFFISQCVYNVDNAKRFLTDYCELLSKTKEEPVPVVFTVTPCGSLKTLQFMEWLGIEIPDWLRNELSTSEDMLSRSVSACEEIIDELVSFSTDLCVPVGFNVESVAIRRDEIEASLQLVRYVAKKWESTATPADA
jgi:hypothetical protein